MIFDLDGTLLDSSPGILGSFQATLREIGRSATTEQLLHLIGPPLKESFATLGVPEEDLDDVVALYRGFYADFGIRDATMYEGMRDTLADLYEEGVHLAVATAKRVDFARMMLHDRQVGHLFDYIGGASLDLTVTAKYDIIAEVLNQWSLAPSQNVWMIGDRDYDMLAGRRHGLWAVGVRWGFGSDEELRDAGANMLLDAPDGLASDLMVGGESPCMAGQCCQACGAMGDEHRDDEPPGDVVVSS